MYFDYLGFVNFRNLENTKIHLSPGLNVFVGNNGQGKSNILEAISLLTSGKSFRPFKNIHIINKDTHTAQCAVGGKLVNNVVNQSLEFQIKEQSKFHFLNQKKTSSNLIQRKFPIITFSPESLSAIKSGPDERRNLLDEWICLYRPDKIQTLTDFSKALKNRNRLLKDYKKEKIYLDEFEALFDSLNHTYYRLCTDVTMLRVQAIKDIHNFFNKCMQRISGTKAKVSMQYLVSDVDVTGDSLDKIGHRLQERAEELRFAEIASGGSLFGPHKHDVIIQYNDNDSRYFCSQGQQRALILSFKIAQIVYYNARYGVFPLLLLDDVLSELDEEKRSFLVGFLKEYKAQTFVTTTELGSSNLSNSENMKLFKIERGKISEEKLQQLTGMESSEYESRNEFL